MNANLPIVGFVQLTNYLVNVPHRIVLTSIVVAHNADHSHSFFIDGLADALWVDLKRVARWLYETWLDVEVLEELLPRRLVASGDDHVGPHRAHHVVAQSVAFLVPRPPAKLEGETSQQASLGGTDSSRARVDAVFLEVVRSRAVPQICDHIHN